MATLEHAVDLVECQSLYATVDEATLLSIHGLKMDLPIACDFCSHKFYDLNMFDSHMLTHLECRYFSCQLCNNTYQSWGNLVAHRKASHHGKVLSCEDCGKRKLHLNLGPVNYPVGDLVHGCEECNEGFSSMPLLVRHYSRIHGQFHSSSYTTERLNAENGHHMPEDSIVMNLVCPLCKARFINLKELSAHIRKQDPVQNHVNLTCNICHTEFCSDLLLSEHIASSHSNVPLKECNCGTQIQIENNTDAVNGDDQPLFEDEKDNLKRPLLLSCPICTKVFTVAAALKCHIKLHNSNKESSKIGSKTMKNTKILINHLESKHYKHQTAKKKNVIKIVKNKHVIHKKFKFICEYCGREFRKKENMTLHVRRHLGERPYTCQYCEKSFFTNQQLSIHNYQHTGERPFVCKTQMCNKSFTSPTALNMHCKVHNNFKKYSCPHCHKKFFYHSSYLGHVRLHTGQRPFCCSLCNKTFILKSKLNVHLKTHIQQNSSPHRCSDCGNCFGTIEELNSHCNEECCVTLVTVTTGNESLMNKKEGHDGNQYNIRFVDNLSQCHQHP